MNLQLLRSVTTLALLLGGSAASHAWEVLGCPFGPDVSAFINCVNNSSAQAANQAVSNASQAYEDTVSGLEQQIETLEASPFFAQVPAEQEALLALRQMPIQAFNSCLAEAGLNLGSVMGGSMTNPSGFTQARLNDLFTRMVDLSGPLLNASLADLRAGITPVSTSQAVSQAVDNAYAAMTLMAEEDPVARCALPLMAAHQNQIKQVARAAYDVAESQLGEVITRTVQPAVDQAMAASLEVAFQNIRGSGAGRSRQPQPRRSDSMRQMPSKPGAPIYEPLDRASQPPAAKGPAKPLAQATTTRQPPRTRSIRDMAQAVTAGAVPDDVERMALAVFTERMLDPRRLQALTGEINALSAALANGSAASFDGGDLDKLIGELSVPGDRLATELGIEVARFYGHWTLDKAGGLLLDVGLGSAAATEAVVMEVGGAICSIGDVFSGVPCAIIKGIVSFVYLQVALPLVNQAMMAGYHVAYEQLVECAAQAIRAGQNPAVRSGQCGLLGPALRWFPSGEQLAAFALPKLESTRVALLSYQAAVGNLATVSRQTAGRRR